MRVIVQRTIGLTHIATELPDEGGHIGPRMEAQFQGPGLVVLLGWMRSDDLERIDEAESWIRTKVCGLRIFPDRENRMNLNLADYMEENKLPDGGILWVPQFTLASTLDSGFRPSFIDALDPQSARERFKIFVSRCRMEKVPYKQIYGSFGADMHLTFTNWGPVTIPLERL